MRKYFLIGLSVDCFGYFSNPYFLSKSKKYGFDEYDFRDEIDIIDKITDYLYLGSCKSALDTIENNKLGIYNILNLSGYNLHVPNNITVYQIKIDDDDIFPIQKYFEMTNEIINNVCRKNQKILVHCRAGHSRSPTVVIAYLMKYEKNDI